MFALPTFSFCFILVVPTILYITLGLNYGPALIFTLMSSILGVKLNKFSFSYNEIIIFFIFLFFSFTSFIINNQFNFVPFSIFLVFIFFILYCKNFSNLIIQLNYDRIRFFAYFLLFLSLIFYIFEINFQLIRSVKPIFIFPEPFRLIEFILPIFIFDYLKGNFFKKTLILIFFAFFGLFVKSIISIFCFFYVAFFLTKINLHYLIFLILLLLGFLVSFFSFQYPIFDDPYFYRRFILNQDSTQSLVFFLSGYERLFINFINTYGFGLGFNNMGYEDNFGNISTIIYPHQGTSTYDGTVLISKFVSEIGILAVVVVVIFISFFIKIRRMVLKSSLSDAVVFAFALYSMLPISLFIRSTGYFTIMNFMILIGYYYLRKKYADRSL